MEESKGEERDHISVKSSKASILAAILDNNKSKKGKKKHRQSAMDLGVKNEEPKRLNKFAMLDNKANKSAMIKVPHGLINSTILSVSNESDS